MADVADVADVPDVADVVALTRATYDRVAADYDRQSSAVAQAFVAFRDQFAAAVRAGGAGAATGVAGGQGGAAGGRAGPVADLGCGPGRDLAALLHVPRADVPATLRAWRELLAPGGRLGLSTALDGQDGWEPVPYAADPEVAPAGLQRWFVHHDRAGLLTLLAEAGFEVLSDEVRVSHRTWLQVHAVAG